MARRPTTRNRLEAILTRYVPVIRDAFLEAVFDWRDNAELGRLVAALEAGDLETAINALHLDPAALRGLDTAVQATYAAGGQATVQGMPALRGADGARVVIRFDMRNPRAELWLREHGATMVTRITQDQHAMVREVLVQGMEAGQNPRRVALDIVGRVNRATGRREGGLIGLTQQQAQYVTNARRELLSNDPEAMTRYFRRRRRDASLDRQLMRYIRNGEAIPRDLIDRAMGRYNDRLLQLRGETISRLEGKGALHSASDEAFNQAVDTGAVKRQNIKRRWVHLANENEREQHVAMHGQEVGQDEPFIAPDGTRLMYPCDPNAPVSHTANCHCQLETRIDFAAQLLG